MVCLCYVLMKMSKETNQVMCCHCLVISVYQLCLHITMVFKAVSIYEMITDSQSIQRSVTLLFAIITCNKQVDLNHEINELMMWRITSPVIKASTFRVVG